MKPEVALIWQVVSWSCNGFGSEVGLFKVRHGRVKESESKIT